MAATWVVLVMVVMPGQLFVGGELANGGMPWRRRRNPRARMAVISSRRSRTVIFSGASAFGPQVGRRRSSARDGAGTMDWVWERRGIVGLLVVGSSLIVWRKTVSYNKGGGENGGSGTGKWRLMGSNERVRVQPLEVRCVTKSVERQNSRAETIPINLK